MIFFLLGAGLILWYPSSLQASLGFACIAYAGADRVIPAVRDAFIAQGLSGRDLLKPGGRDSGPIM